MVADDSAVIRGLLTRLLESDPSIAVAASVPNGEVALRTLSREDDRNVIRLSQGPPENYCRPSADPMFRSLSKVLGPGLLPGAVAMAGLCSAVLPLGEITPYVRKLVMRSAA
jgi:chemotaxis response regulator CheB